MRAFFSAAFYRDVFESFMLILLYMVEPNPFPRNNVNV